MADDWTARETGGGGAAIEAAAAAAALERAGALGWRAVTLPGVAEAAGVDLGALRRVVADKTDLLRLFVRGIDADVLGEDPGFSAADSVRDRLFDLLMRRFDALDPYKAGLRSAFEATLRDPVAALQLGPFGVQALGWYLEAAGVSADGPLGALRAHGLAAAWLSALRTWFEDETEDLSQTMAALDKALARAEGAAGWLEGRGRRASATAAETAPPPADVRHEGEPPGGDDRTP